MLRSTVVGLMFGGLIAGWAAFAAAETIRELEPSSEPIHVRVLFKDRPAHEAVVAWTTTTPGEAHHIYVDTEPREGELDAYAQRLPSIHSQAYSLRSDEEQAGMHAWTHNVFLGELEPATRYYLTVVSDGEASEEYYFKTAPNDDRPVRLVAVGDSRTPAAGRTHPDNERRQVNALMARLMEEHPDIIALAHGADYTNRAYWSQLYWWLKDHAEATTTSDNRLLPIIPSRGNHDLDVGFEEKFWWPDRQNDYYYTTHLNTEAALITLNTEISRGGDQRDWLEAQLTELRPEKRWLLAMYHRPAYPSVRDYGSGSAQRRAWVPLFEEHGLDAAYESHDHALKRSYPIFDGQVDHRRGIVYFGDGGAGVPQRHPDPSRWYLEVTGRHHHTHLISFHRDRLHIQAINIDEEIVDDFTLSPRGVQPPYTGLERAGAFIRHLAAMLDDRDTVEPAARNVAADLLRQYLAHYEPDAPDTREAFIQGVRQLYDDAEAQEVERRMAYQLLLLHADWTDGEHLRLLEAGRNDQSDAIRALTTALETVGLESEAGQAMIMDLGSSEGVVQRLERAFAAVRDEPERRLPVGLDDEAMVKVHAFRLPAQGWRFRRDPSRVGYFERWHEAEPDDAWKPFEIETAWGNLLDENYIGAGWYRRVVEFPEVEEEFDTLTLHFAGVDHAGWVWVDGEYVGQQNIGGPGWNQPFELDVTDYITPGERHEIVIRVMNTSHAGGVWEPVHLRVYQRQE